VPGHFITTHVEIVILITLMMVPATCLPGSVTWVGKGSNHEPAVNLGCPGGGGDVQQTTYPLGQGVGYVGDRLCRC
jgi:hypothetical protein